MLCLDAGLSERGEWSKGELVGLKAPKSDYQVGPSTLCNAEEAYILVNSVNLI